MSAELAEIEDLAIRLFLADLNRADDDGRGWDDVSEEERVEYRKLAKGVIC